MNDPGTKPDPRELVARLASNEERWKAFEQLVGQGLSARDAVREGLRHVLIERIRLDESIRVRRHTVAMLASQHAHPDLEGFFQELLDTETDAKLHKHAGIGLMMCRRPDLTVPQAARLAARESRRREGWPNHI